MVTASRRLAREVMLHFADLQSKREAVWQRPDVLPWPDWIRTLWQEMLWAGQGSAALRLLGNGQFQLVWEQVVFRSEGDSLLQTRAAARQAAKAWELALEWQLPWRKAREFASEDAARFLDWAGEYRRICKAAGWIDQTRLADLLADQLADESSLRLPGLLTLAGFDELTPQQQRLSDVLEQCGTTVTRWLPARTQGAVTKRSAADAPAELTAAANWCCETLQADPGCSIGVVVPDLSERYEEVGRVFADVLSPGDCEGQSETIEPVFSISAGPPLARQPMVHTALGLVGVAAAVPSWAQASQLLRSRFLGEAQLESDRRAALDVALREFGGTRWSLGHIAGQIRKAIDAGTDDACPLLLSRIDKALALRAAWPRHMGIHDWVQAISAWLDVFGWPGEQALNSDEYQLLARWRELLEEIAAYEHVLGKVSIAELLRLLERLSAEARFKPESDRCAVQVLGVLEAAGLEFDRLWVCGLHDGVWPPAPSPTPFLPYALQRAQGMPHSSSARELTIAGLQLKRLTASADEVVLSWPAKEGDRELRQSPLIEVFGEDAVTEADAEQRFQRDVSLFEARPGLEKISDVSAPGLTAAEAGKGGARVLELQAWCPFRAFAELRLRARPMAQPAAGIDAINRGSIVHDSLHELWRALGGRDTLERLAPAARRALVKKSIASVMQPLEIDADALMRRLLKLESRRLEKLIGELLLLELQRPSFKVEMLEQRRVASIGPLQLRTRLDRLDILGDGGRLLIDYKTGNATPGHWFGSRPRAPQLPLYAVGLGLEDIRGLAFVKVRSAGVQFTGVCAAADGMPPGVKPPTRTQLADQGVSDWQALMNDWGDKLGRLASEYQQGASRVDPLSNACRYCHLQTLCRVDERLDLGELSQDV